MDNQLSYLNNFNKPNLVDISLLQKINDGYNFNPPKMSYLYSMVQSAGAATCNLAKDNLFISVIVVSLIFFLGWCYIEKKRQDAIYEKYLQKKLAKSLLNDELNLFSETPEPINIEKLFNDISTDISNEKLETNTQDPVPPPIENQESNQEHNQEPHQEPHQVSNQELVLSQKPVHMTKREHNLQIYDSNQRIPDHMSNTQPPTQQAQQPQQQAQYKEVKQTPPTIEAAILKKTSGSKYMEISNFNPNSYMLM
jgi:hypothetical protein